MRAELEAAHERVRELNVARDDLAGQRDRLADALGIAERERDALRTSLEHTRIDRDEYRDRLQLAARGRVTRWRDRLPAGLGERWPFGRRSRGG